MNLQIQGTELLKQIDHENIIKLLDQQDRIFVFELMDCTLANFINKYYEEGIDFSITLHIVEQILEGLLMLKVSDIHVLIF